MFVNEPAHVSLQPTLAWPPRVWRLCDLDGESLGLLADWAGPLAIDWAGLSRNVPLPWDQVVSEPRLPFVPEALSQFPELKRLSTTSLTPAVLRKISSTCYLALVGAHPNAPWPWPALSKERNVSIQLVLDLVRPPASLDVR
jgi:hypothetical protein